MDVPSWAKTPITRAVLPPALFLFVFTQDWGSLGPYELVRGRGGAGPGRLCRLRAARQTFTPATSRLAGRMPGGSGPGQRRAQQHEGREPLGGVERWTTGGAGGWV